MGCRPTTRPGILSTARSCPWPEQRVRTGGSGGTLTAIVTGAAFLSGVKCWLFDIPDRAEQGHAFVAMNVGAMMGLDTFKTRMDAMIREIKNAPKTEGGRIYLPGEMEWERQEKANREGLRLPDYVLVNLIGLAQDTGTEADLAAIFR